MQTTTPSPSAAPDEDSRDEARFKNFLQDMVGGRQDELAAHLHPEVVWHLPPFTRQKPIVGAGAVLQFLREGAAAVYESNSLTLKPELIAVCQGKASCLATIRGRLKDGRPYENQYAFFARMVAGKITEVWEILDSALLLDQLNPKS
jgi:ketosteroid isomerase-like protein